MRYLHHAGSEEDAQLVTAVFTTSTPVGVNVRIAVPGRSRSTVAGATSGPGQ